MKYEYFWRSDNPVVKFLRNYRKYIYCFIAGFLSSCVFAAAPVKMVVLHHCLEDDAKCNHHVDIDWGKIDVFPIILACEMEYRRAKKQKRSIRKICITSNCRMDNPHSKHYPDPDSGICHAVDFYFAYTGKNACEDWKQYKADSEDLFYYFIMSGWDGQASLGIYTNFTHHSDVTGKRRLWGFIGKTEVAYAVAMNWVEDKIKKVCNEG